VFVARLTGLGPDAPLSESVSLDTHIRDVVDLLQRHDLRDVVLVGHSYGGMIVTGAAEHARDRIAHLVYVDALVPEHGQSALDIMTAPMADTFRQMAAAGGGWRMRPSAKLVETAHVVASVKEDYPARVVFEPFAAQARREGWGYHELPTGHDCQAEMPDALSELLVQTAAYSPRNVHSPL
jgi:pimeloyl-ACP methyl ester carboxylesterase